MSNDILAGSANISYAEANAALFNAIEYVKQNERERQQTSEVALSIIRIVEAINNGNFVSWENVREILSIYGLEKL